MEAGEARSVFMLVQFSCGPCRTGLYEIKIQQGGEVLMGPEDVPIGPVFKFFDKPSTYGVPKYSYLEGARFFSRSKLYLLVNEGQLQIPGKSATRSDNYKGYSFDTKARSLGTFKAPLAAKPVSYVMSAYGKLYNLASPICFPDIPKTLFECYNPKIKSWESLPHFAYCQERQYMQITGYAVCYGCILVSIGHGHRFELLVFNIESNTWHQVNIPRTDAYYAAFRGRAVIVDNTIYALSVQVGKVISFSLRIETEDDGRIICFLEKPFFLPGLDSRVEDDLDCSGYTRPTECLVHLGKLEFCLLQTFSTGLKVSQELFITTFEIVRDETMHIKTIDSKICDLYIEGSGRIFISLCFTPDCEELEPRKEEAFQLTQEKGTAQKHNAYNSKVHDVDFDDVHGRFMDGFTFVLKPRWRLVRKWPRKFCLSRPAVNPLSVYVMMAVLVFAFYNF